MSDPNFRARARRAAVAVLATFTFGCGKAPATPPIVPSATRGRQAVEAAMSTWKAGHPPGIVEPTEPRVQVIDTHREAGQRLIGHEFLADTADARGRTFTLRLNLSGAQEGPVVRFLVVGIDPVLVFREEDYELLMHWEHRMDGPSPATATVPPAPGGAAK